MPPPVLSLFKRTLSLKTKLLLWVMPIVVIGLGSLSLTAYWYINAVIEEELSKSMLASVGKSAESINRWLGTIMFEPETIASTPAAKGINEDFSLLDAQNINRHKIFHQKHPDIFQDIYAANRHGEYHTVIQEGDSFKLFVGDISNRPYFRSIMAGGPTQITPPLISRTTGIPTIFMVSPILDDRNQPQGLIGAGISLRYIQQIAQELQAGDTGYGFILARDGTFIYHPNDDFIMQSKITTFDDPSGKILGDQMISGASGVFYYSDLGQDMIAFFHPIPISGWSVATVIPEAELFAPAIKMVKLLIFMTLIFIVLVGTAILMTMQRLTAPLQSLAAKSQEIAAGNLKVPALAVQTQDEIGRLSLAFNVMIDNLRSTLSGLRQSEVKYRSIFENSPIGIFQATMDGHLLSANPAMVAMLGYDSYESMEATTVYLQRHLYLKNEDREHILTHLKESGRLKGHEVQLSTRGDKGIWVSMDITLIRDPSGIPIRLEALVSDISGKKKVEGEREDLQGQLAQAQKLEAVGKLAGGVAHDFNNMLSVILGKTEMALLGLTPEHPFHGTFSDIQKAASHSANLTRQLLTFARKQTVSPKVIDLNRVLGDTLNMLRRLIGEDIEVIKVPLTGLWSVKVDPDQVGQILTNLCVNARDAIEGVGTIVITTKNVSLDAASCAGLHQSQPGEYVCLSVSDDGPGMAKSVQEHMFEPFFTTKGSDQGTGLGLATIYGIVKQNKGFVHVYSEPGHGTTFNIYLPRYDGDVMESGVRISTEGIVLGEETILLVEDESALLELNQIMIEELGYKVFPANSPEEAMEIAREQGSRIHLLLTDVVMPKMNGRDLAIQITSDYPEIRCLFISGYTADIIAEKGVLDEGTHFLQKPFTIQSLATKIREVLATAPTGI